MIFDMMYGKSYDKICDFDKTKCRGVGASRDKEIHESSTKKL